MKKLAIVVIVVSLAMTAQARLLETKAQLIKRYGDGIDQKNGVYSFKAGDLDIRVTFGASRQVQGGVSVEGLSISERVCISKVTFSEEQMTNILESNSGGSVWLSYQQDEARKLMPKGPLTEAMYWLPVKKAKDIWRNAKTKDGNRWAEVGSTQITIKLLNVEFLPAKESKY